MTRARPSGRWHDRACRRRSEGGTLLPDSARELFDGVNHATVACLNPDGSPHTSVVWVKTDGGDILFSTVKGRRKHRNILRDPRVSILVMDSGNPYRYAEVRGIATMIDDPEADLIQELSRKYTGRPWDVHPDGERVIVRITPKKVFVR
ncbi:MAG: PPOX class F420-dependent oxidoreductase [Thermobispora bispora]|uniref:PPOX class F420-dependent oxidoreductase n=1 Tax=Thermobispora bispora TaxID=2006 RepID=UPI00194ED0E4|nr:PPOX class F420-dependent oxidoreductase [Thermobispora bispora]MBX6168493.1 PPOX class F420-dependent oxidoreductase [Thermobispora bispora]